MTAGRVLVTGGAGFLGSRFVELALKRWESARIVVLDALTYAGNRRNLEAALASGRVTFVKGDICDPDTVHMALSGCNLVFNFAAESHVDRSIVSAQQAIHTSVEGTRVLLDAAVALGAHRFIQISTDEVYGPIAAPETAREDSPVAPSSPYAASKAAADLLCLAWQRTYGLPVTITRGANTYGPRQYPEKLVSLFITNALAGRPLPLYGNGRQTRDWLHVDDHCQAILTTTEAPPGLFNVGAHEEQTNRAMAARILHLVGADPGLLQTVADRPGHDRRYALNTDRIDAVGWVPSVPLDVGLTQTVTWYRAHADWWQ